MSSRRLLRSFGRLRAGGFLRRGDASTNVAQSVATECGWIVNLQARWQSASTLGKVIPFNLPDIGEGIAEVEVLRWHVKEGDKISQFDKLLEVQSDKATVDITSRYDGTVTRLYHKVGDMAKTGKPLVDIELAPTTIKSAIASAAAASAPAPSASTQSPAPASSSAPSSQAAKGIAAPAVRHLAKQHGLAVGDLPGTGKDGRVTKEDILKVIAGKEGGSAAAAGAGASSAPAASAPRPAPATGSKQPAPIPPALPISTAGVPADRREPIRGMGRIMVKSMTASWTVPHFGYCDEIVMDGLMQLRSQLKPSADAAGVKLTFLPLLVKAASMALAQYPSLNGQLSGDNTELIIRGSHNIGVAMDTPRGLIVPNVKAVQSRSILEVAHELGRLQALAAAGQLGEADLTDTTFSLSNIGTIGGTYASPIIPVPNVAIGAIGRIAKVPKYASTMPGAGKAAKGEVDALVPAHVMQVSWAADHRVVDGATMARFSNAWKGFLEQPATMLAHLR